MQYNNVVRRYLAYLTISQNIIWIHYINDIVMIGLRELKAVCSLKKKIYVCQREGNKFQDNAGPSISVREMWQYPSKLRNKLLSSPSFKREAQCLESLCGF